VKIITMNKTCKNHKLILLVIYHTFCNNPKANMGICRRKTRWC